MSGIDGSTRVLARALPRRAGIAIVAIVLILGGCKSTKEQTPAASTGIAAAPAVTQASWAPDVLEELLAPIALYPDALVGQILAASVNSQEVLDAGNWLLENQNLQGDALDTAAKQAGFGPAMLALVHFPPVVDMMCQEFDWTKQLGAAFTSDQKAVLDAVQRLRAQAVEMGNLKTTPQQTVEEKTEKGVTYVEVKPADPQIVYVPQYNAQAVYTQPAPPATSSSTVVEDDDDSDVLAGLLLFGAGMAVGAAINNSYCYPSWGYGAVYMGPRPFYPPAYAYRPAYPAYRPAYGYHSPAGYRYNYNNVNVNRGNNNITINNNFNRFENNSNLKDRGGSRSPLANTKHAGTREASRGATAGRNQPSAGTRDVKSGQAARNAGGQGDANWKGKSSYAGAKNKGGGTNRATTAHTDRGYGGSSRPGAGGSGSAAARPSTPQASSGTRAGATSRPSASTASPPSTRTPSSGVSSGTSRVGSDAATRSAGSAARSGGSVPSSSQGSGALSSASHSGSGSFERASSARGRASTSSSASTASSRSSSSGGARAGGGGRMGR
jgi:hypothetical protein